MIKIKSPRKPRTRTPGNGTRLTTAGFSLVELMVVVIILGSLAALSAPSILRSLERNNARDEARAIANVFQRARAVATSSGQPVMVTFSTAAGGSAITLNRPTNQDITSCAAVTGVPVDEILTYTIGSRYPNAVTGNNVGLASLCFSPSGRLVIAGSNRPFVATTPFNCEDRNVLIWLHRPGSAADDEHKECIRSNTTAIGAQKDARELINFFLIHVPYAGNAEVLQ